MASSLLSPSFYNSIWHTIKHMKIKTQREREKCSINQRREREAERGLAKALVQAQRGWLLLGWDHGDRGSALAWSHWSGGRHPPGSLGQTDKQKLHPPEARTGHGTEEGAG